MIDFKKLEAEINNGDQVLEAALCLNTKGSKVVFIVDNCDQRLTSYMEKLGIRSCISLTCNSSTITRKRELEKWRTGQYKFLFVKKLYRSCNIVRSYITEYAKSIIVTRNVIASSDIVSLLNECDSAVMKNSDKLEFIYLMKDFEFTYHYGGCNSLDKSSIVATRNVRDKQSCPWCNTKNNNLAKKCLKCGFDFPHQSFVSNTELRIGVIVDDFNPTLNNKLRIRLFNNLEYLLEALHKNKDLTRASAKRDYGRNFDYSMMVESISNYAHGSLVCLIFNSKSKLTFLSMIPSSICIELREAWRKYADKIFSSVQIIGVYELLSNLALFDLQTSSGSFGYGYCKNFNDIQSEIIKKKFIENDLVAQAIAQENHSQKFKLDISEVNIYAERLHSLFEIDDEKIRSSVIRSKVSCYINSLVKDSNLL